MVQSCERVLTLVLRNTHQQKTPEKNQCKGLSFIQTSKWAILWREKYIIWKSHCDSPMALSSGGIK